MMHNRRLSLLVLILVFVSLPILILANQDLLNPQDSQPCQCFNGGTCSSNDKYIACQCPPGFIGIKCQTQAFKIDQNDQQTVINQNYTYFYFEPKEINYYQISLKICLPQNQRKKLTNLVFLQVQRSSGKLKLQPSIYQTSPISFEGKQDRCQIFYTHFIPIRKKLNDQYQRIIFGVAIKNNSDSNANRWVNFLQRTMVNPDESLKANQIFSDDQNESDSSHQPQVENQKIIISCTYQLYLVQNYWGSFIIIMSAITLFVSTGVFLYTIRNKYSYTLSNEDILRLYAINPEDFFHSNQRTKNDLSHFRFLMPIMSYELLLQKQNRAQKKYPKNMLKRRIQANKNETDKQTAIGQEKPPICDRFQRHDVHSDSGSNPLSEESTISIENTCTICLLNFEKAQKIRQTPCRHIFHSQCIDNWCETTLNCPICRQNLEMPRIRSRNRFRTIQLS